MYLHCELNTIQSTLRAGLGYNDFNSRFLVFIMICTERVECFISAGQDRGLAIRNEPVVLLRIIIVSIRDPYLVT